MKCSKSVFEKFYGDEGKSGSRSPIISDLKKWAKINQKKSKKNKIETPPHRIIIGSHKIGKKLTVERSLNRLDVKYYFINENTNIYALDHFALDLKDYFFYRKNPSIVVREAFEAEVKKLIEISCKNKFHDKLLSFLSLIQNIKKEDPQIRIILVYESKSQLDTELYEALINCGTRFIFKLKVSKNELFDDDDSLTVGKLFSEAYLHKLKPLTVEESKRMIRGEHPDIKQSNICGITQDVVERIFIKNDSSCEDMILDIVGCYPYLLNMLCCKIIDKLDSISNEKDHGVELFLSNIIREISDTFDIFFLSFFSKMKQYRNDLFEAYQKWIRDKIEPDEKYIGLMNQFGMTFEKDNKIHIPLLFSEYILNNTVENFGSSNQNLYNRRTIVDKKNILSGINHILETVDKIPGVNLITAPIHSAVKGELTDIQKEELYEYISSIITNSEKKTIGHLLDLKDNLEDLKNILENIKAVEKLRIDDFYKSGINIEPSKINLDDDIVRKIEHRFKEATKTLLLHSYSDNASAREFYLEFENNIKVSSCGDLISGINIEINSDTNALIFNKIFIKYDRLKNSEEKSKYISLLHTTKENRITKEWFTFLEYLKTHE